MISSFIAQNFAISDDYWVWNESNIIENLKKSSKKIHSWRKNVLPWSLLRWLPWSTLVTIVVTKARKRTIVVVDFALVEFAKLYFMYVCTYFFRQGIQYILYYIQHAYMHKRGYMTGGSFPPSLPTPTPDPNPEGGQNWGEKTCDFENLAPSSPGISTLMHVYACMSSTFYQNNMPCVPCQISRVWLIQKTHFPPLHITYIHSILYFNVFLYYYL